MNISKVILQKRNIFVLGSFTAGFSLMTVELTASRIIAPIIGNSIYSWTSIIGIVLLGLAIGSFIGGRIADEYNNSSLLPIMILIAAVFVFLINILSKNTAWINNIGNIATISILLSIFLFFIPSIFIGTIQPLILKKYVSDFNKIGSGYGLLSTTWTLGSILGVFLTGFILVSYLGSFEIIKMVSIILTLLSITFAVIDNNKRLMYIGTFILLILIYFFLFKNASSGLDNNLVYETETKYYNARVVDFDYPSLGKARGLFLDFSSHSIEFEEDNNHFWYTNSHPILRSLNEEAKEILVIGGGAYTLPKNLAKIFPDSNVEVIEIDSEITKIAEEYFNLDSERIKTKIGDARFLMNRDDVSKYDLIFGDAFSSFVSVPGHLLTYEWNELVKSRLKPDGVYAVNMVSAISGSNSSLFQSVLKTFEKTFGNYVVLSLANKLNQIQNVIIIGVNNDSEVDLEELRKKVANSENPMLANLIIDKEKIVLNDDVIILYDNFHPIERLNSRMIKAYFRRHSDFVNDFVFNSL